MQCNAPLIGKKKSCLTIGQDHTGDEKFAAMKKKNDASLEVWCSAVAGKSSSGVGKLQTGKIGEIKVSVQKLCLKQGFFKDTNLDHLTSGWPRTHCFRGDANFDMFPKKYG